MVTKSYDNGGKSSLVERGRDGLLVCLGEGWGLFSICTEGRSHCVEVYRVRKSALKTPTWTVVLEIYGHKFINPT